MQCHDRSATPRHLVVHMHRCMPSQEHSGPGAGFGSMVSNLLQSLPLLRAPLRSLSLQRGKYTLLSGMHQAVPACIAMMSMP